MPWRCWVDDAQRSSLVAPRSGFGLNELSGARHNLWLPETVIFPFTDKAETVLRDLANQPCREWLAVGDLKEVLGGLVLLQVISKCFQRVGTWREAKVSFVCGEGE